MNVTNLDCKTMMNPSRPFHQPVAPPWLAPLPPDPPMTSAFWVAMNVRDRLSDLQHTLALAKAMRKELEVLMLARDGEGSLEDPEDGSSNGASVSGFLKLLDDRRINVESQVPLSVESANSLMSRLRFQLEPFRVITDETSPWEVKSAAIQLAEKIRKSKRNKLWRKRKRKRVAETLAKERERFDQADQEADEWRAREIAKDIAKRKVEKMEEVAKLKAKEERRKLESELELVLIVEKLQELRSIRIQKLKNKGHFLPEEDDKFLERVQAAVEEEERQAIAAAETDAAKDAIATAEESRKQTYNPESDLKDLGSDKGENVGNTGQGSPSKTDKNSSEPVGKESGKQVLETQGYNGAYDSVGNLPIEFYHYYHGSNSDIGTLVEVRRTWDAYIRPGGSRIPGHWVQPPPPANDIWASYLVRPK